MRLLSFSFVFFFFCGEAAQAFYPQPTVAPNGMVASGNPLATKAGLSTLKAGGNAVDAAIAATFAISVVEPFPPALAAVGFCSFTKKMKTACAPWIFVSAPP